MKKGPDAAHARILNLAHLIVLWPILTYHLVSVLAPMQCKGWDRKKLFQPSQAQPIHWTKQTYSSCESSNKCHHQPFHCLFLIWRIIIFPCFPPTLVNSTRKIARFTKSSLTRNSVWCRQSMKPLETISTERQSTDLFPPIPNLTSLFHKSMAPHQSCVQTGRESARTGTKTGSRPHWQIKCALVSANLPASK